MRASDLIGATVRTEAGHELGRVRDLTIVQDGPLGGSFDAGLRVDGLVVGGGGLATRLGYERGGLRGPWLIRALVARRERRGHYVRWTDVVRWDEGAGLLLVRSTSTAPASS